MVFCCGMNDVIVSIDKAGRVVLPKQVREELAINPGDLLKISIHGDQITLRPTRETCGFIRRGRALVFSSGEASFLDNETVETVRADERGSLLGGLSRGLPSKARK
jgi:AbrB family looped-hinge helix DNA binding protein